jgi:hypothetical protein
VNDLLNPDQRRSVTIVLRMFEENLRQAEAWLQDAEVNGILYQRKLNLSPARRQAAQQRVAAALEQVAALAQEIGLEPEVEDPAGLIRGELSVSWANLIESQSSKLKRFGDVNPGLESVLDPAIQHLAQATLELAALFENPPFTAAASDNVHADRKSPRPRNPRFKRQPHRGSRSRPG